MKVTIEKYRGVEISFDSSEEKFKSVINEDLELSKPSFSGMKKSIDDFIKENNTFNPINVILIDNYKYKGENALFKVIGIRKDNRFVVENVKSGEKMQISDYDLKDFLLECSEINIILKEMDEIKEKLEPLNNAYHTANAKLKALPSLRSVLSQYKQ